MKNLATCKPSEFLKQTNKIRKSVGRWLEDTDILNIRERAPEITEDMTKEDVDKAIKEQIRENFQDILNAVLEEYPDETLEVLALINFVEPEDVDKYPVCEYLESMSEIINNEAVLGFFTSLAKLGNTNGVTVARP